MQIGIIANPASGKDIRRLNARASVFDNQEKTAIVRRCLAGMFSIAKPEIHYLADSGRIAESAIYSMEIPARKLPVIAEGTWQDSMHAAVALRGVDVVISLGGDGTNRAITKGWLDVPLIAISTGTNNAFPIMSEATIAGLAAVFVAQEPLATSLVSERSKVVHVDIEDEDSDLALIDVVATSDRFVGARAIVDPAQYKFSILSRADASKVGMAGVAGAMCSIGSEDPFGLVLKFNDTSEEAYQVKCAVAPGVIRIVNINHYRKISLGESVSFKGPAVLAFDGERERVLREGQRARFAVERNGPRLINSDDCVRLAADRGLFRTNVQQVHSHA